MPNILVRGGILIVALAFVACNDESLGSAVGQIELAMCDRGEACGCSVLPAAGATIDFGSPPVGQTARRILRIRNANQPQTLSIGSLTIQGDLFTITGVRELSSEDDGAEVRTHDMAHDPLELDDTELAEVLLAYEPNAEGSNETTLEITSNSRTNRTTTVQLRAGGGSAQTCAAGGECGDLTTVGFGTYQDEEIAYDSAAGLPKALATQTVTITNEGPTELHFDIALSRDGIPEAPGELPGERGVFFLPRDLGCTVVPPGESFELPIEYRPSSAGEHHGELLVATFGAPEHILLEGRVIGAHICLHTEDDVPDDALLQFGDAPEYDTPSNRRDPEIRRIFIENCGFEEDLVVSDAQEVQGTAADFSTSALPWTQTNPIAPGERIEMPVTLTPTAAVGTRISGRYLLTTNDRRSPTAVVDLLGRIGSPEVCALVASPSPVDFGWVATDDADLGSECPPPPLPCPGGSGLKLSRIKEVSIVNVGERPCTGVTIGPITAASGSEGMFELESNPNGDGFTLQPGASSQPIQLLFVRDPIDEPQNHMGRLGYDSPDLMIGDLDVLLKAKAGGSPHCSIGFEPVSPPSLFCSDESLAFGNVNFGQSKTIDLQVHNTGSQECNVTNVRPVSGTSQAFSFPSTPLTIPVGEFRTIPVTFSPLPPSGDPFEELPFMCGGNGVEMKANSGTGGAIQTERVGFTGKGKAPSIDVIPGEIDFGEVTVGCCSAEQRIAIYNSGTTTLFIDSIDLVGASSEFALVRQPGSTTLRNGQHTDFAVRFCANGVGPASGVVEIRGHDDNDNVESFSVALSGTGTLDSEATEVYEQPSRPKVDVLWVVDDSASMQEEQDNLANNFDNFIGRAVELNTDYHLGVTNTDGKTEWSGRLHSCSPNRFIVDSQPNAEQQAQFRCNVNTSSPADGRPNTDDKESALQAARAAFEYPNLDEWNDGFYREDAKLYVILVTDEEDQSDGEVAMYVDFFRNLKGVGNPDLLNLSAITGPPPEGCDTADANQVDYDAVNLAGGQFRSICNPDWSDLLDALGLDVFNSRRQFPLARPATAATITVRVCEDGCPADPLTCPLVAQNSNNGWTFDGSVNAVTFHGAASPAAGECVVIDYTAFCYQ